MDRVSDTKNHTMLKGATAVILGLATAAVADVPPLMRPAAAAPIAVVPKVDDRPPAALPEILAILDEKAKRTDDEVKIDSQMLLAMRVVQDGTLEKAPIYVSDFIRQHVADDLTIAITIYAPVTDELLATLKDLEARDVNANKEYGATTARMPIVNLLRLASLKDVRSLQLFDPGTGARYVPAPEELRVRRARLSAFAGKLGATTSQGVVAHAADKVHSAGIDGSGVKICVLSDGVNSLAARQASGDLPPGVDVLPGQAGSGDEGTAMLEIVHDMAPGATLGFATALGGTAQFATNIQAMRGPGHNCDIFVDDWTYFLESPFQEGDVAQAVTTVTNSGALFVSDAANSGSLAKGTSGTWEGDYVASGISIGLATGMLHQFGAHVYDTITLPSQVGFGFYALTWSDPLGASANDYDLFILDATQSYVIGQSTNRQNGAQNPQEAIASNSIPAGAQLIVVNYQNAAPRALRVDTERGRLVLGTSGNTFGHNAGVSTVTIAAVDVGTAGGGTFAGGGKNPVENFSSDGPRRLFYAPNGAPITPGNVLFATNGGTVLNRVDLAAADGVTTQTAGFNPFYGTSAAAPHAAAIAALVKSANPALTNAQIRSVLQSTALDIEGAGYDVNAGTGIVMADAAVRAVLQPLEVTMAFTPSSITPGGTATLAITLKNKNAVALHGVSFTDTYPANLVNAANPNPQLAGTGCTGNVTGAGGAGSLALAAAKVPGAATCTLTITVTASTGGSFVNSTGSVTTPIGLDAPAAVASLSTCAYALSPTDLSNVPKAGGTYNVTVTTAPGCDVPAQSYQAWVAIGAHASSGPTIVPLQIGANAGAARATSVQIADRLFLVTQL